MILVTGGTGMVGSAVVDQLLDKGYAVRSVSQEPDLNPQVDAHVGDIRDLEFVRQRCKGIEGVIHTASLVDLHLGRPDRLYDINVGGVQNLITACRENGVGYLSHMSSAEVIAGESAFTNADESMPYPDPHLTFYGETKERGERLVLEANDDQLATCAFRTFGIFGERDRNFVHRAIQMTRGKQIPKLGDNSGKSDIIYAGNIAHALILGFESMKNDGKANGHVFHVTDSDPMSVTDFIVTMLKPLGFGRSNLSVGFKTATRVAQLSEKIYQLTKSERFAYPPLTRHQLLLATQDYYLDSQKIRDMLGYEPLFDRDTAIKRTQAWLKEIY